MSEQNEQDTYDELEKVKEVRKRFEGKVPDSFLIQMTPTGVIGDYINRILIDDVIAMHFDPKLPLTLKDRIPQFLRMRLEHVTTYNEYWHEKIISYNNRSPEYGTDKIDPDQVMEVMVSNVPNIVKLDEIALQLKEMADKEDLMDTFNLERLIRLQAESRGIIFGEEDKLKTLKHFGLDEK